MRLHPEVSQLKGVVTVALQRQFVGDSTDADDQARILAYGDPLINLGGTFQDSRDPAFTFRTGSSLVSVPLSKVYENPAQFMVTLPEPVLGSPLPSQGPLVVVTSDPARAASVWKTTIASRISDAMVTLRALPTPISSLPDSTI